MVTFAEVVKFRTGDDSTGLRFGDDSWTWSEVVQESCDRAAALESLAKTDGQLHIGVLLENVPDYVFWIGAAALHGAVVVGINPTRRGAELARDIRHTQCDMIVTEGRLSSLLEGLDHGVCSKNVFDIDSPHYQDFLAPHRGAQPPTHAPAAEDMLLLLFSSGSTDAPKGVICSQGRLGLLAETLVARTELTRDSVTYVAMPLFHGNSAMMNLAPAVRVGATVCLTRKFSASGFARDIHRFGVTFVNYVGRALAYVLAQPESENDRTSTLQLAIGTEASPADIERFSERFNCRVSEGYGASEGVLRINRTPDTPTDALGLPVGGADVRVMDESTGAECLPADLDRHGRLRNAEAAIGQIVGIDMAPRFEGYYNNPDADAERVRGNDFWTGDLAYRDMDGFFYFAGRSSDWLRVDSENFSAAPVERILLRWSDLAIGLVYAVPDPRTGDQVMCALQMKPGVEFDPSLLSEFLHQQPDMGTKWRPRFVRLVTEVPTTANNKPVKAGLRQQTWVTSDPVFWSPEPGGAYELLEQAGRIRLEQEFKTNQRTALLPVGRTEVTP